MRVILSLLLIGLLAGCAGTSGGKELVGKHAPFTKFALLDSYDYALVEDMRGKNTVVVFWTTWCAKSRRALGRLNQFAARFKGRDDVVFLAASIDKADKAEAVRDRVKFTRLDNFIHAFSGNDAYDEAYVSFRGENLPYIVIIKPDGVIADSGYDDEIVYRYFGVDPESVPEFREP